MAIQRFRGLTGLLAGKLIPAGWDRKLVNVRAAYTLEVLRNGRTGRRRSKACRAPRAARRCWQHHWLLTHRPGSYARPTLLRPEHQQYAGYLLRHPHRPTVLRRRREETDPDVPHRYHARAVHGGRHRVHR